MRHNFRRIKSILAQILPGIYGESYIVAGGYARDVAFGRVPRDADVLIPFSDGVYAGVKHSLHTHGIPHTSYPVYEDNEADPHIKRVIKLPDDEIDLIFTAYPLRDTIDLFDYNFNKAFMDIHGRANYPDGLPMELVCTGQYIREERREYMQSKWEELTCIRNEDFPTFY